MFWGLWSNYRAQRAQGCYGDYPRANLSNDIAQLPCLSRPSFFCIAATRARYGLEHWGLGLRA